VLLGAERSSAPGEEERGEDECRWSHAFDTAGTTG
jgi:hypothetical protein